MTSLVIINYSGQKTKDLEEQAVLTFVSDLRRVQSMAMSVVDCNGIQESYSLTTQTTSYKIDCNSQTINLPSGVQFTQGAKTTIAFWPIRKDHPTLEVTGNTQFKIGTSPLIQISPEGKITY